MAMELRTCCVMLLSVVGILSDVRLPPEITVQPSSYTYTFYDVIILECEATGIPNVEFYWHKNNRDLDLDIVDNVIRMATDNGSIKISPATALDQGYYQCFARNRYGTAMSVVSVLRRAMLSTYPPADARTFQVTQGEPLSVTCLPIKSYPAPEYSWSITESKFFDPNPKPLDLDRRVQQDDYGNLYFANVQSTDMQSGKMYTCVVYNPMLGMTVRGSFAKVIVLPGTNETKPVQRQYSTPGHTIGVVGRSIQLKCLFTGLPTPNVTWSRIGGSLTSSRHQVTDFGTAFKISDLRTDDEGDYKCEGDNGENTQQHTMKLDVQSAPTFVSSQDRPYSINGTEGGQVSFLCNTTGEPVPYVRWFKNGQQLDKHNLGPQMSISDGGKVLTVYNLCKDCGGGQEDLMVIQCNASNIHGYVYSEGYLNVLSRTVLTVKPADINVTDVGDEVLFNCSATSDDSTPVVTSWCFNGVEIQHGNSEYEILPHGLRLLVKTVINPRSLEGQYSCVADNGYSQEKADAQLYINIAHLPPVITVQPRSYTYTNDDIIILECEATGVPDVEFYWYKNHRKFDLDSVGNVTRMAADKGSIKFSPATALDEGYYQCFARNRHGTAMSVVSVLRRFMLGVYPPADSRTFDVTQGEPFSIPCLPIKSYPAPEYSWGITESKFDLYLKLRALDRRVQQDDYGNLYFANVQLTDMQSGEMYTCVVYNKKLQSTVRGSYSKLIVRQGTDETKPVQRMYSTPRHTTGVVGRFIQLKCLFTGLPTPNVTWSRVGGSRMDSHHQVTDFGTALKISDLRPDDEGDYKCEGDNGEDKQQHTMTLDVQSAPTFVSSEDKPYSVNRTEGEQVSFLCNSTGEPAPTVRWFKNGQQLDSLGNLGPRMSISDGGKVLTVYNLCKDCGGGQEDLMVIQCNASNIHGYVYSEGYLNVLSRTVLTVKPADANVIDVGDEVLFNCSATSDDRTPVVTRWYFNGVEIQHGNSEYEILPHGLRLLVKTVMNPSSLEGQYSCVADNGYSQEKADAQLYINIAHLPPVITVQPSPHTYTYDDIIILECEATGIPDVEFYWHKNHREYDLDSVGNVIRLAADKGSIKFSPATALDEGYYQCFARNRHGTAMSVVSLLRRAMLGVYPPADVRTFQVTQGEPLSIPCMPIKSYLAAKYSWGITESKFDPNSKLLDLDQRVQQDDYGNLYFANVQSTDMQSGKMYTCVVYNKKLELTVRGSYSKLIVLQGTNETKPVQRQYSTPRHIIGVVGKSIQLKCLFTGLPTPNVTWSRVGGSLMDSHHQVTDFGTALKISELRPDDEGDYICEGDNGEYTQQYTMKLDVQSAPTFVSSEDRPYSVIKTEGEQVSFLCNSTGEPVPTVRWFRNGQQLDKQNLGPRMSVSNGGKVLTVYNLCKDCGGGQEDLMVIQCNASNIHGYVYSEGYLNVLSRTVLTVKPADANVTDVDDKVLFNCSATSDDSTPVVTRWYFNGVEIKHGNSDYEILPHGLRLLVRTVSNPWSLEGEYSCVGDNGYSQEKAHGQLYINIEKEMWKYVTVRPGAHMFYWLYYTYHSSGYLNRPLIMWLQGGPGASSCGYGNFELIGPLTKNQEQRETTWVNQASVLFVDQPVGSGYSYVDNSTLYTTTTQEIVDDLYVLIKVFYQQNPQFKTVPFYIFGQSYGGKIAAVITQHLHKKILEGDIEMNLSGFAMGNSWIHPMDHISVWGDVLYTMSNVDEKDRDKINLMAKECKKALDSGNTTHSLNTLSDMEWIIRNVTNHVDFYNILKYNNFNQDSNAGNVLAGHKRRSVLSGFVNDLHLRGSDSITLNELMNGKIKEKLRIIPKDVAWGAGFDIVFEKQLQDFLNPVVNSVGDILENTDLDVIVYQGQLDLICSTKGAMKWMSRLQENWMDYSHFYNSSRTWLVSPVTGQTDTFVKAYNNFKFYWNLRAGHSVPKDDAWGAYRMLQRILADTHN